MPRVVLRADASAQMGSGHLIRSAALGRALAPYADVTVVTVCEHAPLIDHVERLGLTVRRLPPDQEYSAVALSGDRADAGPLALAVVDGYHFDVRYFDQLHEVAHRVATIEDYPRALSPSIDVLLDHNLGALRQPYRTGVSTRLLLGPTFSLLRPEFATVPKREPAEGPVRRGLVTLGGGDAGNATRRVLQALAPDGIDFEWTVLIGGANQHADALEREFGAVTYLHLIRNVLDMPSLLRNVDIAVAAVGGTMWEMARMGVPTLLLSLNAPQGRIGAEVAAYGAHRWCGDAGETSPADLRAAVADLAADRAGRAEMRRLGQSLIDGRGADRAAAALFSNADWNIRPARLGDAEPLWEIAADPSVRRLAFDSRPFNFADHERWFGDRLARSSSRIWVIERDGVAAGFARYDVEADAAMISIAVATALRGRGLGTRLLSATADAACSELGVGHARGLVFEDNAASIAAFARAGFTSAGQVIERGQRCRVFEWRMRAA